MCFLRNQAEHHNRWDHWMCFSIFTFVVLQVLVMQDLADQKEAIRDALKFQYAEVDDYVPKVPGRASVNTNPQF